MDRKLNVSSLGQQDDDAHVAIRQAPGIAMAEWLIQLVWVGRFLDELSKSNAFALPIADEGSGDWWASTRTSSSPNYRGDCGTRRRPAPIDVCGCSAMQLQPMEKTDSAGIDDIGAGKARQDTRML